MTMTWVFSWYTMAQKSFTVVCRQPWVAMYTLQCSEFLPSSRMLYGDGSDRNMGMTADCSGLHYSSSWAERSGGPKGGSNLKGSNPSKGICPLMLQNSFYTSLWNHSASKYLMLSLKCDSLPSRSVVGLVAICSLAS